MISYTNEEMAGNHERKLLEITVMAVTFFLSIIVLYIFAPGRYLDVAIYKLPLPRCNHQKERRLENGFKGNPVLIFQTIDSVVTNDSLQALVKQFYGLTIAYDEVTNTDPKVLCPQLVNFIV